MFKPGGGGVAQGDHVFTQLDAGHLAFGLQGVAQVIVDGEGQVALARPEVRHTHRLVQRQGGRRQRMAEHFDELVDLLPLARHRRDQLVLAVGHTEVGEKRPTQVKKTVFLTVVLGRWHFAQLLRLALKQR
ncbi:hypothetical protein D9M73_170700 [compost metagenome]